MSDSKEEIQKRTETAIAAIRQSLATGASESAVSLFVSHHVEELGAEYWKKHCGIASPEPSQVLEILALDSHWSEEDDDGLDNFDFTLPDEVTNYLISVSFNEDGTVADIAMES